MDKDVIDLNDAKIERGQTVQITHRIARLPTHTNIDIPIYVSRAKEKGPAMLIMAGLHGDEVNGIEIVRRIIVDGYHIPERGTVICIPVVNIYGFINFSREVPDGKDVNRSFPGRKTGSLASQVAHYLMSEIIPLVDYGIDFHTGGARRNNFPQIRTTLDDPENLELAKAFAAPFIINSRLRDRSLRKEAFKLKKRILVFEGGESLRLRKSAIDEGINGMLRVMKHLDLIHAAPEAEHDPIIIDKTTWIRARVSGLYHSFVRNGEFVEKKRVVGLITDPFGEFEIKVKANANGYVIGINNNPVINRGDALLHIGLSDQVLAQKK